MFTPFQSYIKRAANHYGIRGAMEAAKICHDFRTVMPEVFSKTPKATDYIHPAHFKNGTLTLNVASPAWAQEVIMRKEKIIDEMNTKAGKAVIKHLRTQLRSGLF